MIPLWIGKFLLKHSFKLLTLWRFPLKDKNKSKNGSNNKNNPKKELTLENWKHIRDFVFEDLNNFDREILLEFFKSHENQWKHIIISYDNPEINSQLNTGHILLGKNKILEFIRRLKVSKGYTVTPQEDYYKKKIH